jgi:hypothetical protein
VKAIDGERLKVHVREEGSSGGSDKIAFRLNFECLEEKPGHNLVTIELELEGNLKYSIVEAKSCSDQTLTGEPKAAMKGLII